MEDGVWQSSFGGSKLVSELLLVAVSNIFYVALGHELMLSFRLHPHDNIVHTLVRFNWY